MSGESPARGASFWNELYWFVAIGLVGWIVASIVLPPRLSEMARFLQQERSALADLRTLQEQESILEGAVTAMENDPYYRNGAIRARLGIKRNDEEYIQLPNRSGR